MPVKGPDKSEVATEPEAGVVDAQVEEWNIDEAMEQAEAEDSVFYEFADGTEAEAADRMPVKAADKSEVVTKTKPEPEIGLAHCDEPIPEQADAEPCDEPVPEQASTQQEEGVAESDESAGAESGYGISGEVLVRTIYLHNQ